MSSSGADWESILGLDHGAGHSILYGLPYGSARWTEGSRRYLNGC
jgi:hypothetical protein